MGSQMNIYKPAGFWIRLGAALLDYIIVSVPLLLIYWLIKIGRAHV